MKRQIGPYRIVRELPHRGMGVVYQAYDEALNRPAALKTFIPKRATDDDMRARLHREAQAQARLAHDNVVAIYTLLEDDPDLFIVMEWVDGETLEQLLAARSPLLLPEAMRLFNQLLAALHFVHEHGVVHRDVKPSNVMISGGRVKLMDFGIALLAGIPRQTASIIGTALYMSPEQFHTPAKVDRRTDIYSAALVLYEMLAGRLPYEEDGPLATRVAGVLRPPELETLVEGLPAGVSEAVDIALRRDPDERFQTIAQFRDALAEGALGFLPSHADPQNDIPTERLPHAVEAGEDPEPVAWAADGISSATWLWIVSLTLVVLSVIVSIPLLQQFFRVPPPASAARVPVTRMVVIHDAAPAVRQTPQVPAPAPAVAQPQNVERARLEKAIPFAQQPEPVVASDDAEARRHELEQFREEIARAFERAEGLLGIEKFDGVQAELDAITEKVQRYPTDLWQEGDAVRRFTGRLNDARVAVRTRAMQEAMWEGQLAEIRQEIDRGQFPEAQNGARRLIADSSVPERFTARARQLLREAHDRFVQTFEDAHTGETKNTIRKPSSPPRN